MAEKKQAEFLQWFNPTLDASREIGIKFLLVFLPDWSILQKEAEIKYIFFTSFTPLFYCKKVMIINMKTFL